MKKILLLFTSLSLFFISNLNAANRYWIASSGSNWNNSSNWSTSSGGSGGASVPTIGDHVYFDLSGQGNCTLDTPVTVDGINITANYSGTIELAGFSFNLAASGAAHCYFRGGTITDTPGSSSVTYTTSGISHFEGTTFNAPINIVSGRVRFSGGTFNNPVIVEDNGGSSTNGAGGCTFNSTLKVTNSGSSYFLMGYTNADIFNGDVTLINNSTSRIRIAYASAGNQFNGNIIVESIKGSGIYFGENGGQSTLANTKVISAGVGGFTTGDLRLKNFVQSGTTTQTIALTDSARVRTYSGTIFNGNINITAPRITLSSTTFSGTSQFEKSGSGDDYSGGGNTFTGNSIVTNSSTSRFVLGNGIPDTFSANLTVNNSGSNQTYVAYNSAGNIINGDLIVNNNSSTGTGNYVYLSQNSSSSLTVNGPAIFNNTTSSSNGRIYIGDHGDVTFNNAVTLNNNATGNNAYIYLANNLNSQVSISGTTNVTNNGSGNAKQIFLGNQGDVTFNGSLNLINHSGATYSEIVLSEGTNSNNTYNDNITVSSTNNNSDGIRFGRNGGSGTLASTKTITIGGSGFSAGELRLRNFTQTGNTPQTLNLTGTGFLYFYNASFGGNVLFSAPRMITRGTTYSGTAVLEKTGAISDGSAGGNIFVGNTELKNSGTGYFQMGNGTSDNFQANLILNNTGTSHMYLAYNSSGNSVGGTLTINNSSSGSSSNIYLASTTPTGLSVGGVTNINNTSSATSSNIYIGSKGDISFSDNVTINNNSTGTTGQVIIASDSSSSITFTNPVTINNNGGGTTKRLYIGNHGDITFNSTLNISNNSNAQNSEIYLNHRPNSSNYYNDNIVLESTNAASDGFRFGDNQGTGTLANTKTITVGGSGFIAGQLQLRNFNQIGNTPQNITLTGTGYFYNYNSNFGGNVTFKAPRFITRGTVYSGTAYIEKTGVTSDASAGGNTFVGNTELKNSGSDYLLMGNGTSDDFQANLILNNTGTSHIYLAHNSAGNNVNGSLTINNSTSGSYSNVILASSTPSTLTVGGITNINNASSSTSSNIFVGIKGKISFSDNVTINNNSTGTTGQVIIANDSSSSITFANPTIINNNGSGTTKRTYVGNQGDVTFNSTLNISNNASATNSEIYLNHGSNSANYYNDNIVIESTHSSSDGIKFGESQGTGTLANTKTITVGASGFIAGQLQLRNFNQIGSTPQSITLTGTGFFYNYNSNFGGNVVFKAPRFNSRGTVYSGTIHLEKTGGIGDDYSAGGNTFTGNTTLVNSGSKSLTFGNGTIDTFSANVDLLNSGTSSMYFARSGAGHTITGNLNIVNSATGSGTCYVTIGNNSSSTLSIGGNVSLISNGSANQLRTYFADNGTATIGGNLIIENSGSGSYSVSAVANTSSSSVTINGNTNVINSNNASARNRVFLGNYGDVTFDGTLNIENYAGSVDSEVHCNKQSTSTNLYNDHITVSSKHVSSDGIFFGNDGGSGTLANTKTITIPGTDVTNYIGGMLLFRNFTQTGTTPHSFELASTASYIYNRDSNWGGNINFKSPRFYSRNTTYSGTAYIEKTGASNDDSYGGNNFVGNTEIVLNNNVGTGRLYLAGSAINTYGSNLILNNKGAFSDLLLGNAAGTYSIGGNLTLSNESKGTGSQQVYLSNNNSSIFNINGNVTVNNSSTSTSGIHNIYLSNRGLVNITGNVVADNSGANGVSKNIQIGNSGSVSINGNLTMTNSSTASTAQFALANSSGSTVTIGGNTSLTNNGAGSNKQCYLGNYGDITFNGDLNMTNNSSATYSEIYLNYRSSSQNIFNGNITVKSTHTSCDGFVFGNSGGTSTLAATKTISIPGSGATNYIGGNLILKNFTQIGSTAQSLELGSSANYLNIQYSNWGGNVNFKAPRVLTRNTTYSGTSLLEKTGANHDASSGGNTFVGNAELKNSGTGYMLMGNGSPDDFQANLVMNNNSSHNMYLAYKSSGNTVGGNLTVNHNSNTNNTYTYLSNASSSTLTVSGSTTLNNNASGNVGYIILGDNGDVTLNNSLNINNNGATVNGHVIVANNTNSQVTVNGTSSIINSSAGTYKRVYLGNSGDLIFNGNLNITNNSNATYSEVFCNYNSNSANQYNENISVSSTHSSSDGVRFGQNGGNGTLANSKTITIGGGGFIAGQLMFRNFTQAGNTSQNLILTGTGYLYARNSTWNGILDFRAPRVFTRQTTYNNVTSLEKTGANDDASTGGNIFNDNVVLKNSGTGYFMPSNGLGNDFNGDVTYIKSSSGLIYPAYNSASTYAKDIIVNSSSTVRFGAASSGRVVFDGNSAQSINVVGATPTPEFRDVQTSNNGGDITLNTPIIITKELDLDNGNIITTSTNVIYMNDNTSVSSVSNSAYVDGPIVKIGNDAFTFPTGNDGFYAPITMSKPSSSSSRFEAEYVHTSPQTNGFDTSAISSGLDHISNSEYWLLNRIAGSNNVKATIGWNNTRSGHIGTGTICDIRVARWNGTKWVNEGNGGVTGNATSGTIITGTSEDCASSTKINSWTNGYPITMAIDSNYITWDGSAYDGGSGSGNAPDNSDAGRILKVYGPSAVISSDAALAEIIVTGSGELTINGGVKVTVSDKINNNGSILIENNASLIQTNVGANENQGSGTYKVRREGNNFANSYNIWSSPIQNATLASTFPSTNPCDIWAFDHNNQSWGYDYAVGYSTTCYGNPVTFTATDVIAGGDGVMDIARGYFVPGAASSTREYDGEVNNGEIIKPVVTTGLGNNPSWDQDDWNLMGNPYPSALDAAAFWTENAVNNSRITDAIYFWDGGDTSAGYNQHSDYASWNALGGVNSGNSVTIPSGHIASGQGFWVYASSNSNVVFNNSMRSGNNNQYFKTEAQIDNHLAWISVTTPQNYRNNILIGYNTNTTDSIDHGYDAHKFVGSSHIRFASMIGNEEFAIQGIEALEIGDSKIIPLALFTADSGLHTFEKYKTENLPVSIKVYIRDLDSGDTHEITNNNFTVSLQGNVEYLNRFELIFKNEIGSTGGGNSDKGNPNNGDTTVTSITNIDPTADYNLQREYNSYILSHPNGINGDIKVLDVTGKVIWTRTNITGDSTVRINLESISLGVYFINVVSNKEVKYHSKIIKN